MLPQGLIHMADHACIQAIVYGMIVSGSCVTQRPAVALEEQSIASVFATCMWEVCWGVLLYYTGEMTMICYAAWRT